MQIFQIFFFSDVMWEKNIQKIMSQIDQYLYQTYIWEGLHKPMIMTMNYDL